MSQSKKIKKMMTLLLFFYLLPSLCTSVSPSAAAAAAIYSPIPHSADEAPTSSSHPYLEEVLNAISIKEGWDVKDVRVSQVSRAKVGETHRYGFRLRIGDTAVAIRFLDDIYRWTEVGREGDLGPELVVGLWSKPLVREFEFEGPFELRVSGDDELSLQLPTNITIKGLKKILVRESIVLKVNGAQEIIIIHPSCYGIPLNKSLVNHDSRMHFSSFGDYTCRSLLHIFISGSASLAAYGTHNHNASIEASLLTSNMIELLPDRCYRGYYGKVRDAWVHHRSTWLALLKDILRSTIGDEFFHNRSISLLKADVTVSKIVSFELELDTDLSNNDENNMDTIYSWKTMPTKERKWFHVISRLEGKKLMPLAIKKVQRFVIADTISWSTLMSNLSFTKIRPLMVPSDALTLGVKW